MSPHTHSTARILAHSDQTSEPPTTHSWPPSQPPRDATGLNPRCAPFSMSFQQPLQATPYPSDDLGCFQAQHPSPAHSGRGTWAPSTQPIASPPPLMPRHLPAFVPGQVPPVLRPPHVAHLPARGSAHTHAHGTARGGGSGYRRTQRWRQHHGNRSRTLGLCLKLVPRAPVSGPHGQHPGCTLPWSAAELTGCLGRQSPCTGHTLTG